MMLPMLLVLAASCSRRGVETGATTDPQSKPAAPSPTADAIACPSSPVPHTTMAKQFCAAHPGHSCCEGTHGHWVCNNADYVGWYFAQCPNP